MSAKPSQVRRKLIAFDEDTWHAVEMLSRDSMRTWQELSEEAFRDLLKKHGRADDLKAALKLSIKQSEARTGSPRRSRR